MTVFQLIKPTNGPDWVQMVDDAVISCVPMDPANTDYQRYLDWLAAGNEPEVIEG